MIKSFFKTCFYIQPQTAFNKVPFLVLADFRLFLNRLALNANICMMSAAIQFDSPQSTATASTEILVGMHANLQYMGGRGEKIKDRVATREAPSPAPTILLQL